MVNCGNGWEGSFENGKNKVVLEFDVEKDSGITFYKNIFLANYPFKC